MKTVKKISTIEKLISVCAGLILMMFVSSTASVLADEDSDNAANFGVRGNRITSNCVIDGGVLVIPQVPPPPNTVTPAPCEGKVLALDASPNSRWSVDISWFDPATQKLYLADRNNGGVDIFDTKSETAVGFAGGFIGTRCPGTLACLPAPPANSAGPNGVLTTTRPHQLWAGDGDGSIRVYSLDRNGLPTSNNPLRVISASETGAQRRADELAYDPDHQLVLMAWDDDLDLFIALISVSANPNNIKVVKQIYFKSPNPLGLPCPIGGCSTGGIEQAVYDHGTRKFYLAVPASEGHPNGEIAVIDPQSKEVVNAFDTTGTDSADGVPCFPHGLALGPRQNLLLGCSGDGATGTQMISIIMKATNGKVLQTFTQLGGSDEVWYNPGDNKYYLALSSWTSSGKTGTGNPTPSLGIIDAGSRDSGSGEPEWIQNILTTRTSHSVAAGFGFACERDDRGRGDDKHGGKCDDIVRKHAYVPLTTVPIPLGATATLNESGGIGIFGRLP
jgi:DNA-binding beta-propeller fold protein YncE